MYSLKKNSQPNTDPDGLYWGLWSIWSPKTFLVLFRLVWVVLNNAYCIPAYFGYMFLASPLLLVNPDLYWRLESVLYSWLLSMVAGWATTAGYRIVESGDSIEDAVNDGSNFFFMPNHQSAADVPLCMAMFSMRPGFADNVMWIMDKIFKYTNFGWVSWWHWDFFILAGKSNRQKSLEELRSHLQNVFVPMKRKYLVLFPEGGFLRNRKNVSQGFAKKMGLPHLEHCTLPRTGALEIALDVLNAQNRNSSNNSSSSASVKQNGASSTNNSTTASSSSNNGVHPSASNNENSKTKYRMDKIVDVTIAYPEGKPMGLLDVCLGTRPPCDTHFHYRIFDIHDVPADTVGMQKWIYERYFEKEELLAKYYETGSFPYDLYSAKAEPPRALEQSYAKFAARHLFFIASSYFMWTYSAPLRFLVFG